VTPLPSATLLSEHAPISHPLKNQETRSNSKPQTQVIDALISQIISSVPF
jgi:hypothetical protein